MPPDPCKPRKAASRLRWTLAGLFVTILTACSMTPPTATDVECMAFSIITFSASGDTERTIAEIRRHNSAYRALCEEQ